MYACGTKNLIFMEKEENKVFVHEKILQKVEETCKQQSEEKKFNLNVLSRELQSFFSDKLANLDLPLYRRINSSANTNKGLSSSTVSHAWKSEGKTANGATDDFRDILCYYAFKMNWSETLGLIGITEEEEIQRTKDKREECKCKNEGTPFISKSDSEIKMFAKKIYIELITRKAGIPIDEKNDVIEEVYNSWYKLFDIIRNKLDILPVNCLKDQLNLESAVGISFQILNDILRPHLTEHQARFRSWFAEAKQDPKNKSISPQDLQRKYPDYKILMKSLKKTNEMLIDSANKLFELNNQKQN